jgi:hypothetical protein
MKNILTMGDAHTSKKLLHHKEFVIAVFLWVIVIAGVMTWQSDALPINPLLFASQTALQTTDNCTIPFEVEETLMLPTKNGVSLVMVPKEPATLFVEYENSGKAYKNKTLLQTVVAGQTAKFTINNLRPGNTYAYRVQCKPANQRVPFAPRKEHTFKTLPTKGQTFSFAYATDAHFYDDWSDAMFANKPDLLQVFNKTVSNIASDPSLSFVILGGDNVHTQCISCPGGIVDGVTYDPYSVLTTEQAELRYKKFLAPDNWGVVAKTLPFVYVLGNHEGETNPSINKCGHSPENSDSSVAGRKKYYPDPFSIYGGDPDGRYYAFEAGDMLIGIIDVMHEQDALPKTPDEWQFTGDTQKNFIENTLKNSQATWKALFGEHLMGGDKVEKIECYNYGRGGLRGTSNDLPTGIFKGDQAIIQSWLEQYVVGGGANFFLSGHDHVAITPTEKLKADNSGTRTYYVKGGSVGASAKNWQDGDLFKKEMDWDLDGTADYFTDTIGTLKNGYYRITVSPAQVLFEYVQTDETNELNGTVLYSKTITAE